MLIKVGGGRSGIKEYLESGRKHGRDTAREEMDERVVLSGDLEATAEIIKAIETEGERYLHVTLSFREDSVAPETLEAIAEEFREFLSAGYRDAGEMSYYAEAHLPRLKGHIDQRTGQDVVRKPHLHVVIPKSNLLSGQYLNPLGQLAQYGRYLEAFQEHINCKYGLASPRDHRRHDFTAASEIIGRHKGDIFNGVGAELKAQILEQILLQGVHTWEQFGKLLESYGAPRARNAGTAREYMNVIPEGAAKGINLKDHVFSRAFVELPPEEKRAWLQSRAPGTGLEEPGRPRVTPPDLLEALEHWRDVRAREIRFLNSGNRKAYADYRAAPPEERRQILDALERRFYQKHLVLDLGLPPDGGIDGGRIVLPRTPEAGAERGPDNVVGQLRRDLRESRSSKEQLAEFAVIRKELDARRLLERLAATHGLDPAKYPVAKGADGGDRILAGTRSLNVSDFLTKEMHLPWLQASGILRACHAEQLANAPYAPRMERPSEQLWKEFQEHRAALAIQAKQDRALALKHQRADAAERRAVIKSHFERSRESALKLPLQQRRAQISLARMQRISAEIALQKRLREEREALRPQRLPWRQQYHAFLESKAQEHDERAIAQLRKIADVERKRADHAPRPPSHIDDRFIELFPIASKGKGPSSRLELLIFVAEDVAALPASLPVMPSGMTTNIESNGDVTYFFGSNKVLRDEAKQVRVLASDHASVELGLRLAQKKFGSRPLVLSGSKEFQARVARVAVAAGLRVQFADRRVEALSAQLRIEAKAAKVAERERGRHARANAPPDKNPSKKEPEK